LDHEEFALSFPARNDSTGEVLRVVRFNNVTAMRHNGKVPVNTTADTPALPELRGVRLMSGPIHLCKEIKGERSGNEKFVGSQIKYVRNKVFSQNLTILRARTREEELFTATFPSEAKGFEGHNHSKVYWHEI
jgi:hypothetical protein